MEVKQILYYMFYLVAFTSIVPMSWARDGESSHIGEYDEYWRQKEAEAKKSAVEAYHPNPEEVNQHLNLHVHLALQGGNMTRRGLRTNKGKCLATNPIDRCWRCNPGWAKQRKKMAKCVLGFGRKTLGGRNGKIYIVTDSSDNDLVNPKPGTLRYAVTRKEPLWIIFKTDMVIRLNEELIISSFKTIDARGANVHIAHGAGLTIQFAKHVIIHGIHVHDIVQANGGMIRDSADHFGFRTASDGDAISIFGSTHVWIDHISMSNCKDGLIDVIEGSTAITLSNNHMTDHNEVMLFGASDSYTQDKMMQVTVAFNHFGRGLVQRMPRCRFGFIHVVNNDYTHWLMYAIGGSSGPTIISQGNRYIAPHNDIAKEVTKRDYASESEWKHWTWRSEHDLMENGAFFRESGDRKNAKKFSKQDMIQAKSGSFVTRLTRYAGSLNCAIGKEC